MTSLVRPGRGAAGSGATGGGASGNKASGGGYSACSPHAVTWRTELADAIRDPAELCALLGLPADHAAQAMAAAAVLASVPRADAARDDGGGLPPGRPFPLLVPRPFVARMRRGDPTDPLLLQVLPQAAEAECPPGYQCDPLGEARGLTYPGWLWKYHGRSLIVATASCGVHCRFCFRRHFPYEKAPQSLEDLEPALKRLAAEPAIHEVILSGGDPLTLDDAVLERLAQRLAAIPHLRRLRVHTRLPVVVPSRVTPSLVALLRGARLTPWVVLHINHPNEIDGDVAAAIAMLVDAGVPLLSQSVLLRGVNDRVEILCELFERLVDLRVSPYYLHQLDPVQGAAHFEAPITQGKALLALLRRRLPGYALPRYVRERPNGDAKEPL